MSDKANQVEADREVRGAVGRLLGVGYRWQAGYLVAPDGRPVAPGVVCRCGSGDRCPAHGK